MLFFEAQLFGVNEVPDRPVIDLEAALGEFRHQSTYRELALLDPRNNPGPVLPSDRLRLVPAHLTRRGTPRPAHPLHPPHRRGRANSKLRRRLAARQPTRLNCRNHPLTKIKRIGSAHQMLASSPASILNQNQTDSGIPNRFRLKSPRSRACRANNDTPKDVIAALAPANPAHGGTVADM